MTRQNLKPKLGMSFKHEVIDLLIAVFLEELIFSM